MSSASVSLRAVHRDDVELAADVDRARRARQRRNRRGELAAVGVDVRLRRGLTEMATRRVERDLRSCSRRACSDCELLVVHASVVRARPLAAGLTAGPISLFAASRSFLRQLLRLHELHTEVGGQRERAPAAPGAAAWSSWAPAPSCVVVVAGRRAGRRRRAAPRRPRHRRRARSKPTSATHTVTGTRRAANIPFQVGILAPELQVWPHSAPRPMSRTRRRRASIPGDLAPRARPCRHVAHPAARGRAHPGCSS